MSTEQNQPLRPLNDVVINAEVEERTVVNLDFCKWRYSYKSNKARGGNQKSKGGKNTRPTNWTTSPVALN